MPDEGVISLKLGRGCKAGFRIYPWMGEVTLKKNGITAETEKTRDGVLYTEVLAGDVLTNETRKNNEKGFKIHCHYHNPKSERQRKRVRKTLLPVQ